LCVGFFALELLLAYLSATDAISPRQFALFSILLIVVLFFAFYRYAKARRGTDNQDSNPPLTEDSARRVNNAVKRVRVAVVALPILLLNGLWVTRGQPLLPRLGGAAINLLFTGYFIFLLRKAKKSDTAR
jgi:cbb3-type cytochrome oxidase subunit 3